MHRVWLPGALLAGLAACAPTTQDVDGVRVLYEANCAVRPGNCGYENTPVRVVDRPVTLPKRAYTFFPLAEPLRFVDANRRVWHAPAGTLTDGASIPKIFVSILGRPTAPEYVDAAAMHDAYCGVGNEGGAFYHQARWEDVHRMFFDALVVSGTPERRAKVMFAAVWLGGPRWKVYYTLDALPVATKQQAMAQAMAYIEANDPSLSQLVRYLERLEKRMIRQHPDLYPHLNPGDDDRMGYEEEPYEPSEPEGPYEPPVQDDVFDEGAGEGTAL
ncbi:MAG: DUF1353 domain-containing protein [Rhodobacteraceae bacterium]|jgi:hypothetical protein|uniref:DUF1353 domain-containing protein n=1 Tax=Salipiger TaxID=263377 RepID=UPI0008F10CCA|nr:MULTISPECIES: DUF1353 domain-containing protein [Salipiger]MAB07112.1 DUF1353 domain-containing protein [Paracoccaceae bacterium]GGA17543.1 hypothetical protein GCM10011326_32630 [Salipiger profundus]SFD30574.1 Protein of unknown function [Salipiger profundus]